MINLEALKFSHNMKYTSLYSSMLFSEDNEDIYQKKYNDGTIITIEANTQKLLINYELAFFLNSHESFVKLECIDRLLNLGYKISDISHISNENYFFFNGFKIIFFEWNSDMNLNAMNDHVIYYKSRLVSGIIEYKSKIKNGDIYDYGVFEKKEKKYSLTKNKITNYNNPNFLIEGDTLVSYLGKEKIVMVPEGIKKIESSAFWDNQSIEEVVLPESLINYGGDTFYNCKNLKKVNIPKSVMLIGDNPFAGCINVKVINESKNFIYENDALYSSDKKILIYVSVKGNENYFEIPEGTILIGKHSFFMCDRFNKIIIPKTVTKMKNNPFSGCMHLTIENRSPYYHIIDSVIYNKFKTAIVGCLNNIKIDELKILNSTKAINRNSFWNCVGIKKIILPESLMDIGYNPFVGCSNIHFESHSPMFNVIDGVLYGENGTKLICYPAWKAIGEINLPDNAIVLERGAFSGCNQMTKINLHNVNIISKSCFTNCTSLKKLYVTDLIPYIGEWAFAYCSSLQEVSVGKNTIVDNHAFSNCPAKLIVRKEKENYLFESENFYTLKSMQVSYYGKIDSILIDPPYNSHIDYIGYKDGDYADGYLEFMENRLRLAKNLLSKRGFLVINIDEGEVNNLVNLCKNIFGYNLVSIHKWKKLHPFFDINRNVDANKKVVEYEYIIICKNTETSMLNMIKQPYLDGNIIKEFITNIPDTFDCFGTTSSAKDEIKEIFGSRYYFSTPKPLKLMKELVRATTDKNSIVLDFFAGSGTVGDAVVKLNIEDGGNRKFILVCNNESDICRNVAKRRLETINADFKFVY